MRWGAAEKPCWGKEGRGLRGLAFRPSSMAGGYRSLLLLGSLASSHIGGPPNAAPTMQPRVVNYGKQRSQFCKADRGNFRGIQWKLGPILWHTARWRTNCDPMRCTQANKRCRPDDAQGESAMAESFSFASRSRPYRICDEAVQTSTGTAMASSRIIPGGGKLEKF